MGVSKLLSWCGALGWAGDARSAVARFFVVPRWVDFGMIKKPFRAVLHESHSLLDFFLAPLCLHVWLHYEVGLGLFPLVMAILRVPASPVVNVYEFLHWCVVFLVVIGPGVRDQTWV